MAEGVVSGGWERAGAISWRARRQSGVATWESADLEEFAAAAHGVANRGGANVEAEYESFEKGSVCVTWRIRAQTNLRALIPTAAVGE